MPHHVRRAQVRFRFSRALALLYRCTAAIGIAITLCFARGDWRVHVLTWRYEYHWADGQTIKKAIKCSAPEYVDYLMTWVQNQLDAEDIFPSKVGVPFPKNFQTVVKNIFKRLFRVYAHIYHSHFPKIVSLGEEAHLNTSFKHFTYFVNEFSLIDKKELAPLAELIESLMKKDKV
jgi:MOB kinase activator 1